MCDLLADLVRGWLRLAERLDARARADYAVRVVRTLDHPGLIALHEALADDPARRAEFAAALAAAAEGGELPPDHTGACPGLCPLGVETAAWALRDVELCSPASRWSPYGQAADAIAAAVIDPSTEACELAALHEALADRPGLREQVAALARASRTWEGCP